MDIQGLQKMTLLDFPGRVACTVFLSGCDLRCPFCHNSELIEPGQAESVMTEEEFLSFLKKRKGLLDGVVFTGGEPLLRHELPELIRKVRDLGYPVKLDTNGNHPAQLKKVLSEKLVDYVAMDIKNCREKYAVTCGLETMPIEKIDESIHMLMEGGCNYEFRTTVVKQLHDRDSFIGIAEWIRGAKRYYLQSFTDRDTVLYDGFSAPDPKEIRAWADLVRPHVGLCEVRGVD